MVVLDDGRRRRLGVSRCRGDDGGQWAKCRKRVDERDDGWKEDDTRERNRGKVTEGERRRVLEMATRKIGG